MQSRVALIAGKHKILRVLRFSATKNIRGELLICRLLICYRCFQIFNEYSGDLLYL